MSEATAHDYLWFDEHFPTLAEAYCVTLVRGPTPDGSVDATRAASFDLSEDDERNFDLHSQAAFALAERLTGLPLTRELLNVSGFLGGAVPLPCT
ncbi:DUF6461 domain-containing protein [Streptomyces sp. NPDC048473]|uniref:DUF6461 domain-containing protein n=1 Tax=unclassified Streptomyces TaxID=2593676 RepID=UPI003717A119